MITEISKSELITLMGEGLAKWFFTEKDKIDVICSQDFFEKLKTEVIANQRPEKPYYRKNERW